LPPTFTLQTAGFTTALAYSQARQGLSLLIATQGEVVFAAYAADIWPEQPLPIASGTKSFAGVLAAFAIQAGILSSWDEPVAETFPDWWGNSTQAQITVRHLLNLTCGLAPGRSPLHSGTVPTAAVALASRSAFPAGQRFLYGSGPFQIFAALMQHKLQAHGLGSDVLVYLRQQLFNPLEIMIGDWSHDETGLPHLATGAQLSPHDWLKFGQFLAAQGQWHGQQLLDPQLLQDCWLGSAANPAYGLGFWLNPQGGGVNAWGKPWAQIAVAPTSLVMALGAGNQNLYIFPEQGWVIARMGALNRQEILATPLFNHSEFLGCLLTKTFSTGNSAENRTENGAGNSIENIRENIL
jgi:CubicO group peptidase (beta-lactamase class C family)